MKRLKGFIIFLYIFLTVLVLIIQPAMHKPVTLENMNFKIRDQLMNPQKRIVSDFEVKVKFSRANKTIAKAEDKIIHIKPDDDKQISFDVNSGTQLSQSNADFENNSFITNSDMEMDISANNNTYQEENINFSDQEMLFTEQDLRIADLERPSVEKNVNLEIPEDNIKLNDSDEVGNRKFKASKEEVIAWNAWRSNLQNRIMDESAIEAPVGTLILFSFDVSSSGHITNLTYTCSNKNFASRARADMIDILKRLEGDSILAFPINSQRKKVRFKGGFLLDYTTQYSSPSDYSDYERVRL